MPHRTALVAGGTGLVGRHLVDLLLDDPAWARVVTLGRRPSPRRHPRLEHHVVDFDALENHRDALAADDVFCALGTTIKKAGSKEAFARVDLRYPQKLARLTRLEGAAQFGLVSAMGANPDAFAFYNRTKGDAERAVGVEPFAGVYLFRPSLLLGEREENRPAERFFQRLLAPLAPLMVGPLADLRPIPAETVARAMIETMRAAPGDVRAFSPRDMRRIVQGGDAAYETLHLSPRGR